MDPSNRHWHPHAGSLRREGNHKISYGYLNQIILLDQTMISTCKTDNSVSVQEKNEEEDG